MSAGDALSPHQFGLSESETTEMQIRAVHGHTAQKAGIEPVHSESHVMDVMEGYHDLRKSFPGKPVKVDDEGRPYVSHSEGKYEIRHSDVDSPYEIHHKEFGQVDAFHSITGDASVGDMKEHLHRYLRGEFE